MKIEATDLKKRLAGMKQTDDDVVGRSFNRGLEYAIRLIEIYEEEEGTALAKWGDENGYSGI